jgi:nucleotide-binding universal stress UspA family protein
MLDWTKEEVLMLDEHTPIPGAVICGIDGTESAEGAVRVARKLSAVLRRPLVFVRVVDPGTPLEEIDSVAEELRRLADEDGALWLADVGHPADRLVATAEDEQASLVVLGSHGPRSSLLGSISADVSRRAPCPVVVVPPAADVDLKDANGETSFDGGIARFDLAAAASKTS